MFLLFALIATIYASILLFLAIGFFRTKACTTNRRPSVSIVIAARNEAENLSACLDAVLSQTYSKDRLQVVLVDDRSTDGTEEAVARYRTKHPRLLYLKITKPEPNVSPKKHALTCGLAHAAGELIFLTDADCVPPKEWVAETVPLFTEKVGVVVGLAPFKPEGGWWHKILTLDNLATSFVSAGSLGWQAAVTCTGRNLAYRKVAFEETNGFERFEHVLSGDDDLFLQSVKKRTDWQFRFCLNPKTAVHSPAVQTIAEFVSQRRRHVSAAKYYPPATQILYLLFNISNLLFFLLPIAAMFSTLSAVPVVVALSIKFCVDLGALSAIGIRVGQCRRLLWLPAWEIFFLVNQTVVSPLAFVGKIKWKEL